MDKKINLDELQSRIFSRIPGEVCNGQLYSTHFSSSSFSFMVHTMDTRKRLYKIRYLDMHSQGEIEFALSELSDETLYASAPLHNHDFYELMIVIAGEIKVTFDGLEYLYHVGDACILNRNILHNDTGDDSYEAIFLSITPDYLQSSILGGAFTNPHLAGRLFSGFFLNDLKNELQHERDYIEFFQRNDGKGAEMLKEELTFLEKEMTEKRAGYDYMVCGCLLRIFSILADSRLYQAKYIDLGAAKEKDLLKDARHYIDKRKSRISAQELADAMNFSKNYISRIFKKYLNQTVLEYNQEVCLKEAERLLVKTDLSICEIAHRIGYENRTHFYRIFREKYGMTPQKYRSSH